MQDASRAALQSLAQSPCCLQSQVSGACPSGVGREGQAAGGVPPSLEELFPLLMGLAGQEFVARVSGPLPTTWGFLSPLPPCRVGLAQLGRVFLPGSCPLAAGLACLWEEVSWGLYPAPQSSFFLVSIYLSQHQNLH